MPVRQASPVAGRVRIVESSEHRTVSTLPVNAAEPVFEGHYPGFPIFPGVCVVECVHQTALAVAPTTGQRLELVAVESTRFLSPVFPGDEVTTEIDWSRDGEVWRCSAVVSTARGRSAQVRLRYRLREGR